MLIELTTEQLDFIGTRMIGGQMDYLTAMKVQSLLNHFQAQANTPENLDRRGIKPEVPDAFPDARPQKQKERLNG